MACTCGRAPDVHCSPSCPPARSVLGTEFAKPVRVVEAPGGLLRAIDPYRHDVIVTRPMLLALEKQAEAAPAAK